MTLWSTQNCPRYIVTTQKCLLVYGQWVSSPSLNNWLVRLSNVHVDNPPVWHLCNNTPQNGGHRCLFLFMSMGYFDELSWERIKNICAFTEPGGSAEIGLPSFSFASPSHSPVSHSLIPPCTPSLLATCEVRHTHRADVLLQLGLCRLLSPESASLVLG